MPGIVVADAEYSLVTVAGPSWNRTGFLRTVASM
jgi:hypothetical protein